MSYEKFENPIDRFIAYFDGKLTVIEDLPQIKTTYCCWEDCDKEATSFDSDGYGYCFFHQEFE